MVCCCSLRMVWERFVFFQHIWKCKAVSQEHISDSWMAVKRTSLCHLILRSAINPSETVNTEMNVDCVFKIEHLYFKNDKHHYMTRHMSTLQKPLSFSLNHQYPWTSSSHRPVRQNLNSPSYKTSQNLQGVLSRLPTDWNSLIHLHIFALK